MPTLLNRLKTDFGGKMASIVASGPSLAYINAEFLRKQPTISLNLSFLLFDQWGFTPSVNVFSDKDVLLNNVDLYKRFLLNNNAIIKVLTGRAAQEMPAELMDDTTLVLPQVRPVGEIGFAKIPTRDGFYRANTVAYTATQLAYELDVAGVEIIGMDLSKKVIWGKNGHAFEIQRHPDVPVVDFEHRYQEALKKGLPNNPEQRQIIEKSFAQAYEVFLQSGKTLVNDFRSSLESLPKIDVLNKYHAQPTVAAIIPAKATSNRLPHKNILLLGDKALYLHVIDAALAAHTIDKVYLDTESEKVARYLLERPVDWIQRSKELASNTTDGNKLFCHGASKVSEDIVIQLLPTAPFLSTSSIDEIVYTVKGNSPFDSAFAVNEQRQYLWENGKPLNYDLENIPNAVDLPPLTVECMSAYAVKRDIALERGMRFGYAPKMVFISELESIDINTAEDFLLAQALYKLKYKK